MRKFFLLTLSIFFLLRVNGQMELKPGYYAVFFKDKNGTPASLDSPQTFLSQRAIERRKTQNIAFDYRDLPVSSVYLDSLKKYGLKIWSVSKWLNGAVIKIQDSSQIKLLDTLVKKWDFLLPDYSHLIVPKNYKPKPLKPVEIDSSWYTVKIGDSLDYGKANDQNFLINIPALNAMGYTGKGVYTAVLDAGFWNANKIKVFSHLFDTVQSNGQVLGWYDYVDNDSTVFNTGSHGTMALSTIAARSKNMVGGAPDAYFYLFRTEDENTEYKIEEFNWVVAAEKADSLGVDVISTSLGYNDFDDSVSSYTYDDMNGNTAMSTIGADLAAEKGIIVVVSAGNEGDNSWFFITAPGDGDSVLTVGAVAMWGGVASFSSRGPTSDGRIKPDVVADGLFAIVANQRGKIIASAGTSFSAPTVAGLMICLRQAFPDKKNTDLINAVKLSGSSVKHPNYNVGYGIPNGYIAYKILERQKNNDSDQKVPDNTSTTDSNE